MARKRRDDNKIYYVTLRLFIVASCCALDETSHGLIFKTNEPLLLPLFSNAQ